MKRTAIAIILAATLAVPGALAQSSQKKENQRAYNQLVTQYAVSTLGFLMEQNCRLMDEAAFVDYTKNQKILNEFMFILMGPEENTKLLTSLMKNAQEPERNSCNTDSFKFTLTTYKISGAMATKVKLLEAEDLAKLGTVKVSPVETNKVSPVETNKERPVPSQPVPEPVVDNTPPPSSKSTFEPITRTQVERQPEAEKPQTQQTNTLPAETTTQLGQQQAKVGISLSNYVNPFPYSASAAPPGETQKAMKRRQRQEIIDLRRSQRAELDAFKDNKDNYIDIKAVKKAIENRHGAEYSAMKNRHKQELQAF